MTITVTPPIDFRLLKNVEATTLHNYVQATVIKQHSIAVTVNMSTLSYNTGLSHSINSYSFVYWTPSKTVTYCFS